MLDVRWAGFRESQSVPAFEGLGASLRDRLDWELVEGAYELVSMLDPSRNTHISRN